jgi:hypothetical protein
MRDLETEVTKIVAPPKSIAAWRRSFMQIAAWASALLATGGIALTASRVSAATAPDSIVPRNEEIIRRAYPLAEVKPNPDLQGRIARSHRTGRSPTKPSEPGFVTHTAVKLADMR